jgi:hypothetical protein
MAAISLESILDSELPPSEVQAVLQATAVGSTDPKVSKGYVNALAAVRRTLPSVDINILCRLFQDRCHRQAAFAGLLSNRGG